MQASLKTHASRDPGKFSQWDLGRNMMFELYGMLKDSSPDMHNVHSSYPLYS